ncbi:hypothetical protein QBC34DRAFT_380845 [Podospora aff. communis PSN243]|uniref:BTB domain-containing protein n=1 Tax=Podospora aff. communis PSN243 TaxID=3040156 RepID=A0AAV9GMN3_9PEZI|nr:hypothetical protein QBC34DRAFT_380845 [Podospora aff. communis PSN243]
MVFGEDENILMIHTNVLIFADCYGISGLADLAFGNLNTELIELRPTPRVIQMVMELLAMCFGDEPVPDALKTHILLCTAAKAADFWEDQRFQELVASNAALSAAHVHRVV